MLVGEGTSGSVSNIGGFNNFKYLSLYIWDNISEPIEHIGCEIESKIKSFFVFIKDFLIGLMSKGFIVLRSIWSKKILFLFSSFLIDNNSIVDKE